MLCCIGGVCVPYTAFVPIVILAFKWVAAKLAAMGLLPKCVMDMLNLTTTTTTADGETTTANSCCGTTTKQDGTTVSRVQILKSSDDLMTLLKNNKEQKVVCKFTASWCKPCHKIQPFFEQCSGQYSESAFFTIDVDEHDDIASKYNIAMMPTFLVLQGEETVVATYRGSNENELQAFLKQNL